jgi:hypothetical protein
MREKCKATSKRTGKRCGAWPVEGRTVCKWHGGRARVGAASPSWRHGRYSRYFGQTSLRRQFEAAFDDPNYLELQSEIALTRTAVANVLERIQDRDDIDWTPAVRLLDSLRALSETEQRRIERAGRMVRLEDALAILDAIAASVTANVRDAEALASISTCIAGFTGRQFNRPADALPAGSGDLVD